MRVGNHLQLSEFGRAAVISLAACELWEAAATVEGATRSSALFETSLGDSLPAAVRSTREAMGEAYEAAAQRGAAMSDDELVAYLSAVASELGQSAP